MDNLRTRRLLGYAGILAITAATIALFYGVLKNDQVVIMLALAGYVIAYAVSRQVRRLRLMDEGKGKG